MSKLRILRLLSIKLAPKEKKTIIQRLPAKEPFFGPKIMRNNTDKIGLSEGDDLEPLGQRSPEKEQSESITPEDQKDLTPREYNLLKDKKITREELAAERLRKAAAADAELNKLLKSDLVTTKDYQDYSKQIDALKSPEKIDQLIDEIRDFPEKAAQENTPLPLDNPKLLKLKKSFESTCRLNKDLIGTKQLDDFEKWFDAEITKKPTLAHAKDLLKRLEGIEIKDPGGLYPRRQEFENLSKLYKKYGLSGPMESNFIKAEGLSERKEFRHNAEMIESHFEKQKDTGFYSRNVIRELMQKVLKADNFGEQISTLNEWEKVARKESEGFTYLDEEISIGGVTIKKFSTASKREYLQYYSQCSDLQERDFMVNHWKNLVENEAKLSTKLEEIYKDDAKGLKLAVQSFSELTFQAKQKALTDHQKAIDSNESKEEQHKNLLVTAALTKIDAAAKESIISDKTQDHYTEFFEDENNYKNANTGKPGDVERLEKMYDILVSKTPQNQYKNLAAYKANRDEFNKNLQKYESLDAELTEEDITDWEERYDEASWTKRASIHLELQRALEKAKETNRKRKAVEEKTGVTTESTESNEVNEDKMKLINEATMLIASEKPEEAMDLLREWNKSNPNDMQVLKLLQWAANEMLQNAKSQNDNTEFGISKSEILNDAALKNELEEQHLVEANLTGIEMSARHNQNVQDAQTRAQMESVDNTEEDSIEAAITEDFYDKARAAKDEVILDEDNDGEADQITTISMDNVAMKKEERNDVRQATYEHNSRLRTKEGFTHIQIADQTGKTITSKEARAKQEKELNELENDIADAIEDQTNEATVGGKVFDLTERIAAQRQARKLIEENNQRPVEKSA